MNLSKLAKIAVFDLSRKQMHDLSSFRQLGRQGNGTERSNAMTNQKELNGFMSFSLNLWDTKTDCPIRKGLESLFAPSPNLCHNSLANENAIQNDS